MTISAWIPALASVGAVSLLPLLALPALWLDAAFVAKLRFGLVSLAVGALAGDAFIHLLPESYARFGPGPLTALLALAGFFAFFTLDRHVHARSTHQHSSLVMICVSGTAIHNFLDGVLIGSSYLVSREVGLATTLAIVLHEIPHELGDVGVLMHGGLTLRRAIVVNALCGLAAACGTAAALLVGETAKSAAAYLLPIGAGAFLYLAASVLIPELLKNRHASRAWLDGLLVLAGVGAMTLLALAE